MADTEKARELLGRIKDKNFADMEGAGMPEFKNYEETMLLAGQALAALDEQPACKTSEKHPIKWNKLRNSSNLSTREVGEQNKLACQQPPDDEFVKEFRETLFEREELLSEDGITEDIYKSNLSFIIANAREACDRLISQRQRIEELEEKINIVIRNIKAGAVTIYWVRDFLSRR